MPRNTTTGAVLEAMIVPSLEKGGYEVLTQETVGNRPGGGVHKVDVLAKKKTQTILISLKWQQASGTAEQKIPFEMMCLSDAVLAGHGDSAYLVLGGEGWTLRDYYTSGDMTKYLIHAELVKVVKLETFVRLANNSEL